MMQLLAQTTQPTFVDKCMAVGNLVASLTALIAAVTSLIWVLRSRGNIQTVAKATQVMAADPMTPNLDDELQAKLDTLAGPK
jgi:hypothetical protein